jgi:hypothetical protein
MRAVALRLALNASATAPRWEILALSREVGRDKTPWRGLYQSTPQDRKAADRTRSGTQGTWRCLALCGEEDEIWPPLLAAYPRGIIATSQMVRALRLCSGRYPADEHIRARRHGRNQSGSPQAKTNEPVACESCPPGGGLLKRSLPGPLRGPAEGRRLSPAQGASRSEEPQSGAYEDKGDDVGVITKQEYVCDYCSKTIHNADVLIGKLALRKRGARGLGREVVLALHPACSERLTDTKAARPVRRPRVKSAAEKPAEATKRTRRSTKASGLSRA